MSARERLDAIEARALPHRTQYDDETRILVCECGELDLMIHPDYADELAQEHIATTRQDVPWLIEQVRIRDAALQAVLDRHPPLPAEEWGMVTWTHCGCGAMEYNAELDGIAPAHYPCPTVRVIDTALGGGGA